MKKILSSIMLALALTCTVKAEIDNPPATDYQSQFKTAATNVIDHLLTATNWNIHVEAMYFQAFKEHCGARIGADYIIAPNVYSTLSLCEANGTLYGMTGTFSLKGTWDVGNKGSLLLTFAGKAGAGSTLSGLKFGTFTVPGKTASGGTFFGTVGSDLVISMPKLKYAPDILLGYEKWSNLDGDIFSFGLHWPLHVFTDLM